MKCLRAKFDNNCSRSQQADGLVDDANIASAFAEFFAKPVLAIVIERSSQVTHEYDELRNGYIGSMLLMNICLMYILVDSIVRQLKLGKARGLDNLTAEQFIAHSISYN